MQRYVVSFLLLFFTAVSVSNSQYKVISKPLDWQVQQTEHFNVYFYDEGRNVLPLFSDMIEKNYKSTTEEYKYDLPEKTPIFLYIGHNNFEESNIAGVGEGTGGVSEAFKNRLILYYSGSKHMLDYLIRHEFTHILEFNVLYNGFWKSSRILKSPFYPNWLMEGLAEYNTKELGATERDMYLRDAVNGGKLITVGKLQGFNHVQPHQMTLAYKESNLFMMFISEEYGQEKLKQILVSFRDKFDPNLVLIETLGTTLDVLEKKFYEYLDDRYDISTRNLQEPEKYGEKLTKSKVYPEFNTNPVFLNNDKNVAYISDRNGYPEVIVQDIESGRTVSIAGLKKRNTVEYIESDQKALSATPDGRYLVFVGEKEQKNYIYLYNFEEKKLKTIRTGFDIINSADISADGKKILFIAMSSGYDNIYSCDIEGNNVTKIFGDFNDVSDAVFSKDVSFIVFTKEILTGNPDKPYQRKLFSLNLADSSCEQLTDFENDQYSPSVSPDNENLVFVSDKDGVNNLYSLNLKTKETKKLTDVIGGNFDPVFSNDGKHIAFSSFRKGSRHIYISEASSFDGKAFTKDVNYISKNETALPEVRSLVFRPSRFTPSTDLFFPLLYYSTYDGLYIAMYWQISEMLGNHSALVSTQYSSGADFLDYGVEYSFLKYRPQYFVRFQGQGAYIDWFGYIHETVHSQLYGVTYPLNRYNNLVFAVQTAKDTVINRRNPDNILKTIKNDNSALLGYENSNIERKYIQATSGSRLSLTYQFGTDVFGADYIYGDTSFEYNKFFSLGKENTIGNRFLALTSTGRDKHTYRLIRFDRVRMYADQKAQRYGSNLLVYNLEWRFPIVYDINYYTSFMFPDFLFRSFYGIAFLDAGAISDDNDFKASNFNHSYGLGVQFDTFIIQSYYLPLSFYLSYSPENARYEYFFSLGSAF
ncbi:MAG: hypothetical protein A3J83_00650 [Elusimicrobia bacterium RIFOXYA2_FULL_40_6]|nr:MAG: hypothetical protein A3J83_00650 [Elusimicrobia bacterium RIFOXYA2_FULL_40_6]